MPTKNNFRPQRRYLVIAVLEVRDRHVTTYRIRTAQVWARNSEEAKNTAWIRRIMPRLKGTSEMWITEKALRIAA